MENLRYHYKYPHPNVTTDCVIFGFDGNKLNVLLVERGLEPYKGRWAFPGGFLNMDESAEASALRELQEETGLKGAYIRQFHTFSDPNRDPRERILSVAYYALVRLQEVKGGDDAVKAEWFSLDNVPPLAFDHDKMLQMALKEMRKQIHFEPIGFELLPKKFTIKSLQQLYEAILDVKFDRRNFYNKMIHLGLLDQVNHDDENDVKEINFKFGPLEIDASFTRKPRRDALLYTFNAKKYEEMKQKGFKLEF